MNAERRSSRILDALGFMEAVVWIVFGVLGPLLWMHRLFEAAHYPLVAVIGVGWLLSMGVYSWYFYTKRLATLILSIVLIVVWCITLLFVFWR